MGERFSHLDCSSLKREQFKNRRITGIFPLEHSQCAQCLLFFPGQKAFGVQPLGGCVQPGACLTYLPTCAQEHKAPCLPRQTQMPPSPALCCVWFQLPWLLKSAPSRAKVRPLWLGLSTAIWRQSSSCPHRPRGMKLNSQATRREHGEPFC